MALVLSLSLPAVLIFPVGLEKTLVETGSSDNVVIVRKGSTSGSHERHIGTQFRFNCVPPQVAIDAEGLRLVAKESVVLIALKNAVPRKQPVIPMSSCGVCSFNPFRCFTGNMLLLYVSLGIIGGDCR